MSNLSKTDIPFGGFPLGVTTGNVGGFAVKSCAGLNESLDSADGDRLIWDVNSAYNFPVTGTTFYAVSSSAADTNKSILIEYLTSDHTFVRSIIALNGQTPVLFDTDGFRVNEFSVVDFAGSDGDVYITRTTDVTAGVPNDLSDIVSKADKRHQRSLQCVFTAPKEKYVLLHNLTVSTAKLTAAQFLLKVGVPGVIAPVTSTIVEVYQTTHSLPLFTRLISPKADIFVAAGTEDNNVSLTTRLEYSFVNANIANQIIL